MRSMPTCWSISKDFHGKRHSIHYRHVPNGYLHNTRLNSKQFSLLPTQETLYELISRYVPTSKGISRGICTAIQYAFHLTVTLLSPILPTRTVHASLRLLTDVFPTIFTLYLFLHDIVIRRLTIRNGNDPQRDSYTQKPYDLVQKIAIGKNDRAVG